MFINTEGIFFFESLKQCFVKIAQNKKENDFPINYVSCPSVEHYFEYSGK